MNETVNGIFDRKSVRVFETKAVSDDIKDVLIDCALQAPTAGNQILYSIIDITDVELKKKLSISCDNQPFIATAPVVFVFVADHTRWIKSFEFADAEPRDIGVGDLFLAITDTAIAAQNMVVAAHSLGLGSCYIGDILENCETHRELLSLPRHTVPVCMLCIGYPTAQQLKRPKPNRFDKKYVVGENTYPHLDDSELIRCYIERSNKDDADVKPFNDYMKAFCERKFNSDFSKGMTRSVSKYLEDFK